MVEFPVRVNGKKMIASTLEDISNEVQYIFRVGFSDGFEDEFIVDEDGSTHGTSDKAAPYAKGIRMDVVNVIGLDQNKFYHIFEEIVDGIPTNVWVIEKESAYKVYYNELYRFEMVREGDNWEAVSVSKADRRIDPDIARKVGFLLDGVL